MNICWEEAVTLPDAVVVWDAALLCGGPHKALPREWFIGFGTILKVTKDIALADDNRRTYSRTLSERGPTRAVRGQAGKCVPEVCGFRLDRSQLHHGTDLWRRFKVLVSRFRSSLAERFQDKILPVRSNSGPRPDFLVLQGNRKIWIEVICPEPVGMPDSWVNFEPGTEGDFPHKEILLRWTSAIKEKAEKLIGSTDGKVPGYLKNGIVAADDAYVIAVNGCRLRHGPISALFGISQFPFAAEAVFPIGPYQVQVSRENLEIVQRGHSVRFHIEKSNGALVPTSMFLDTRFAGVSAIWAVELDGSSVVGNHEPTAIIHNPLACNPIPGGFLSADDEYVAVRSGEGYVFSKIETANMKNG